MAGSELSELEEQERMMKQMLRKEMIAKIESKVRSGDRKLLNRLKNLISEDENSEKR
jgi:hypothetical protein